MDLKTASENLLGSIDTSGWIDHGRRCHDGDGQVSSLESQYRDIARTAQAIILTSDGYINEEDHDSINHQSFQL